MSSKRNWNNKKAEFAERFLGEEQKTTEETGIRKKELIKRFFLKNREPAN